jgi:hypothetical protein
LASSLDVSVQTPLHRDGVLEGQAHTPPTQLWVGSHARPQPPQFCASVEGSTHSVPQSFGVDAGHAQAPFTQLCPAVHAVPQAPQFSGSPPVSTQVPLQ